MGHQALQMGAKDFLKYGYLLEGEQAVEVEGLHLVMLGHGGISRFGDHGMGPMSQEYRRDRLVREILWTET